MFFKVITVSFITICAAGNRMLLTKLESDQELPVLQFNGHALLPTIYKYTKDDQHSTLSSILRPDRSAAPNIFEKLQYAPLHDGDSHKNKNGDAEYIKPTPTSAPTNLAESFAKAHLEPRPNAKDMKCYATGYEIEAAASVSRSPGHNAVYRTISEKIETGKPVKISEYVKPIGINLKLETMKTTIKPSPFILTNEHFIINPEILEPIEPVLDKPKRYTPHAKYHRLHLNIARVYSPGQVPPKPAVIPNVYTENYDKIPLHPQVYVPQPYKDLNMNTMLYPVKRHRKGYPFRRSIIHL